MDNLMTWAFLFTNNRITCLLLTERATINNKYLPSFYFRYLDVKNKYTHIHGVSIMKYNYTRYHFDYHYKLKYNWPLMILSYHIRCPFYMANFNVFYLRIRVTKSRHVFSFPTILFYSILLLLAFSVDICLPAICSSCFEGIIIDSVGIRILTNYI